MDWTSKPLLAGIGGVIVGGVIGLGLGSSGSDSAAQLEAQHEVSAGIGSLSQEVGSISQAVGGVDARIAALETRLVAIEGSVATLSQNQTGQLQALGQRLEGFGSELGGQVTTLGGGLVDKLSERFDSLKTELAAVGERLQGGAAPEAAAPEAAAPESAPAAASGEPPAGELVLIGSAATFGETLSVFVSSINPEAGTARVAVNGPATTELAIEEPAEAGDCQLILTGFGEGGAYLLADCAEGAAAPEGAAPAAQQEGSAAPVTGGEAVRIGSTGHFGEGKARVFVSGVDTELQTARIALNGVATSEMKLQDKLDADGCAVTLTAIDAEGATFNVDC